MHATKADALTAFNEAKFGMFIHWGLYAALGGVWKGERMEDGGTGPCVAEWIMRRKSIPRAEYAKLTDSFNPVKFDADEWAQIAADAGMKYMVITAKHHDGFAMYDSAVGDFNIVKATPFRRDVVAELHTACTHRDIRFGVYYSHGLDWRDGGAQGRDLPGVDLAQVNLNAVNDWDPPPGVTEQDYVEHKALVQVEELARKMPDLFLLWFDGEGWQTPESSMRYYRRLYRHAPELVCNSRIGPKGAWDAGDYQSTGDNHIPSPDEIGKTYWETCGTMNNSWGYKSYDHDWKCPVEVLSWLIDVVSRGGNYLLNVGPTGEGVIPVESVRVLREVGKWLRVNGDAIYGTRAWSIFREGPTELSRKGTGQRAKQGFTAQFTPGDFWFTEKDGRVYAIALACPENQQALIRSLKDTPVANVRMLGSDHPVSWESTSDGLRVALPERTSDIGYALGIDLS